MITNVFRACESVCVCVSDFGVDKKLIMGNADECRLMLVVDGGWWPNTKCIGKEIGDRHWLSVWGGLPLTPWAPDFCAPQSSKIVTFCWLMLATNAVTMASPTSTFPNSGCGQG